MMHQQVTLSQLVEENYQSKLAKIQPITEYMFEDRGIYRVEFDDGQSYILRAFRDDVEAELKGQVAVLDYLRHQGLTVPQVLRTKSGAALASDGNWTALMISFIEGELADFAPQTLTRIGSYLG
ncbi:MAG TPA: phosphotransferase, partial [Ktedonobacteraceae bacterium]|nr:phosphotransferase [Ktedonobacteraceae bacterium]